MAIYHANYTFLLKFIRSDLFYAIVLLFFTILVYNFRVWVLRQVTKHHAGSNIGIKVVLAGILSALVIFLYPKITALYGLSFLDFSLGYSRQSVLAFAVYLGLFGFVIYKILVSSDAKNSFVQTILFLTLFVILTIGNARFSLISTFIYYFFIGFGEEFVKYFSGRSVFGRYKVTDSDIIVFCMLAGRGFGFIENIIYVIQNIGHGSLLEQISLGGKIMLQRGIINIGLHCFFTTIIAYWTFRKNTFLVDMRKFVVGALLGVGLHIIYDIVANKGMLIFVPIFVLTGYMAITFFLYQSDILYKEVETQSV